MRALLGARASVISQVPKIANDPVGKSNFLFILAVKLHLLLASQIMKSPEDEGRLGGLQHEESCLGPGLHHLPPQSRVNYQPNGFLDMGLKETSSASTFVPRPMPVDFYKGLQ